MWVYVVIVWMILGAGYWIIKPLLAEDGRFSGDASDPHDVLGQLNDKKEGAYAAIRELEFDLKMGKLSEEDFQVLKRQYMQEAAGYMQEIDALKMRQTEKMVFPAKDGKDIEREVEQQAAAVLPQNSTPKKDVYCASCGRRASVEDKFCGGCGAALKKGRADQASKPEGGDEGMQ